MIVLDTNVIFAVMDASRNAAVVAWMDDQAETSVWTTSITILELRFGIEKLADGRRKDALAAALADFLRLDLDGRILGFGEAEANETAALMARRRAAGRPPRHARDAQREAFRRRGDRADRSVGGVSGGSGALRPRPAAVYNTHPPFVRPDRWIRRPATS